MTVGFLILVSLAVSSVFAQSNPTKTPQNAILTSDPREVVFETFFLKESAYSSGIAAIQNATTMFPILASKAQSNGCSQLTAAIHFSYPLWTAIYGSAALPKNMVSPHEYKGVGNGNFIPSTGGDFFLHIKSGDINCAYELINTFAESIEEYIENSEEVIGWRHGPQTNDLGRDLTNFIDGTENPSTQPDRAAAALISDDPQHINGSFSLIQKWKHNLQAWRSTSVEDQEQVIGRTKLNSTQLDPLPPCAHISRTDQGVWGNIVRHSLPWGDAGGTMHGLLFVAYVNDAHILDNMLIAMVGNSTVSDHVMKFSECIESTMYYVPALQELKFHSGK